MGSSEKIMNRQESVETYGYCSSTEEFSDEVSECSSRSSRSSSISSVVSEIKQTARQNKLLNKLLRKLVKSKNKFDDSVNSAEFECVTCARFDLTDSQPAKCRCM